MGGSPSKQISEALSVIKENVKSREVFKLLGPDAEQRLIALHIQRLIALLGADTEHDELNIGLHVRKYLTDKDKEPAWLVEQIVSAARAADSTLVQQDGQAIRTSEEDAKFLAEGGYVSQRFAEILGRFVVTELPRPSTGEDGLWQQSFLTPLHQILRLVAHFVSEGRRDVNMSSLKDWVERSVFGQLLILWAKRTDRQPITQWEEGGVEHLFTWFFEILVTKRTKEEANVIQVQLRTSDLWEFTFFRKYFLDEEIPKTEFVRDANEYAKIFVGNNLFLSRYQQKEQKLEGVRKDENWEAFIKKINARWTMIVAANQNLEAQSGPAGDNVARASSMLLISEADNGHGSSSAIKPSWLLSETHPAGKSYLQQQSTFFGVSETKVTEPAAQGNASPQSQQFADGTETDTAAGDLNKNAAELRSGPYPDGSPEGDDEPRAAYSRRFSNYGGKKSTSNVVDDTAEQQDLKAFVSAHQWLLLFGVLTTGSIFTLFWLAWYLGLVRLCIFRIGHLLTLRKKKEQKEKQKLEALLEKQGRAKKATPSCISQPGSEPEDEAAPLLSHEKASPAGGVSAEAANQAQPLHLDKEQTQSGEALRTSPTSASQTASDGEAYQLTQEQTSEPGVVTTGVPLHGENFSWERAEEESCAVRSCRPQGT